MNGYNYQYYYFHPLSMLYLNCKVEEKMSHSSFYQTNKENLRIICFIFMGMFSKIISMKLTDIRRICHHFVKEILFLISYRVNYCYCLMISIYSHIWKHLFCQFGYFLY